MTRDEAIGIIVGHDYRYVTEERREAMRVLRGPQPDSEPGLVPLTKDKAIQVLSEIYYETENEKIAIKMSIEALRNETKAIEILKNIDWIGSGAKGMIQDAIDLLEWAENDKG